MRIKRIFTIFLVLGALSFVGCVTTEYPIYLVDGGEFISLETKGSTTYYHYTDSNGEQKHYKNAPS